MNKKEKIIYGIMVITSFLLSLTVFIKDIIMFIHL